MSERTRTSKASVVAIIDALRDFPVVPDEDTACEGLRERKKRLTRQQISDTATGMFLSQGFDAVRIADVAEACGVSEKTVYNYFPTKESLLFDREPSITAAVKRALGSDAPEGSPVDALAAEITSDIERLTVDWTNYVNSTNVSTMMRQFQDLIDTTPSLRAAQRDMMDRITQVAAEELAERAGVDPTEPEPQIAAAAICALYRVQWKALAKYAERGRTVAETGAASIAEVVRAARLIDSGLWSFGLEVQGKSSVKNIEQAARSANKARKQVLTSVRAAKSSWAAET